MCGRVSLTWKWQEINNQPRHGAGALKHKKMEQLKPYNVEAEAMPYDAPVKFLVRQINGIMRGELTLDEETSKQVMDLLKMMQKRYNQSLILASHDKDIASYADRIIIMKDGLIVE